MEVEDATRRPRPQPSTRPAAPDGRDAQSWSYRIERSATRAILDTAGERVLIDCALPWVAAVLAEGAAGEMRSGARPEGGIVVRVEAETRAFDTREFAFLTRGAWHRDAETVIENACTSGFDVRVRPTAGGVEFTYRWRPPRRERAASHVLRPRFHLLVRAVIMQYPALWWAGTRGRVPLHVSGCAIGNASPMLSAPGGIGRSTLLFDELNLGGKTTGDNLAVADGTTIWGLVEPLRVEGTGGRRMPHGRGEAPLPARLRSVQPDRVLLLERGSGELPVLRPCGRDQASRSLIASTYMAGELRRYWSFAATLAAGTGLGPAHPPVTRIADRFATRLPCFSLALGRRGAGGLSHLLDSLETAA